MEKVFERLKKNKPDLEFKDVLYCCEPMLHQMNDYMHVVNKTIEDAESVNRMIETKDMDIHQMKKQNEKFLMEFGEKTSWKKYESMLAKERLINKRLFESHKETMGTDKIIKEGLENTYKDYSKGNGIGGINEFLKGASKRQMF